MNYALNTNTNTLHKIDGCCHSRTNAVKNGEFELFKTENEAISKHQKHMKYCKLCFEDR